MLGIRTSACRSSTSALRRRSPARARGDSVTQDRPGHAGRSARAVDPDLRWPGTCGPRSRPRPARPRSRGLPSAMITTPGRTASTLQPSVANSASGTSMSRMSRSPSSSHRPDRQERQVDDREVVGDRRDHAQQVDQLGGTLPVRQVEDAHVAADQRAELEDPAGIAPQGPPDAEQVRAAARTCRRPRWSRAPRSGRGSGCRPPASRPRGWPARRPGSACPGGAGSRRDRSPAAGRTCRRDPGRRVSTSRTCTVGPSPDSTSRKRIVLAAGEVEIDRATGSRARGPRTLDRTPPRALDEHVAQRSKSCSGRRSAVRVSIVSKDSRGPVGRSTLRRRWLRTPCSPASIGSTRTWRCRAWAAPPDPVGRRDARPGPGGRPGRPAAVDRSRNASSTSARSGPRRRSTCSTPNSWR